MGALSLYLRISDELAARKPTATKIRKGEKQDSRILSRRRKLNSEKMTEAGRNKRGKTSDKVNTHLFSNLVQDAACILQKQHQTGKSKS